MDHSPKYIRCANMYFLHQRQIPTGPQTHDSIIKSGGNDINASSLFDERIAGTFDRFRYWYVRDVFGINCV